MKNIKKYSPIEADHSLDTKERTRLITEWYKKSFDLFIKYGFREETFYDSSINLDMMKLRPGTKELFKFLDNNSIPIIIKSAGVANTIEHFLKANN